MRLGPGFATINLIILRQIREWVIATTEEAANRVKESLAASSTSTSTSNRIASQSFGLISSSGEDDSFTATRTISRSKGNDDHYSRERLYDLKMAMGKLIMDQGKFERCIAVLEETRTTVADLYEDR